MRRSLLSRSAAVCAALLVSLAALPAAAQAAVHARASVRPFAGRAPLTVYFNAVRSSTSHPGRIAQYAWDFGDGTSAVGVRVQHVYTTQGVYAPRLTVTDATGATATTTFSVRATQPGALSMTLPASAPTYQQGAPISGLLQPAAAGQAVRLEGNRSGRWVTLGVARTDAGGAWKLTLRAREPITLRARWAGRIDATSGAVSAAQRLELRPVLSILSTSATAYDHVDVSGTVTPARPGGTVTITVSKGSAVSRSSVPLSGGRRFQISVPAKQVATYDVRVDYGGGGGYLDATTSAQVHAAYPSLSEGASGAAVGVLRRDLDALHYRQATLEPTFGPDLVDAVIAFQKVQGLPRTGSVGPADWAALEHPRAPVLRYPDQGDHLEVDKGHQVLLIARGGQVAGILPVSTAGLPGRFTPEGTFSIQRKVTGFDPSPLGVLYDPMYFTGGYAIHGNPSVPAYPASHGCVRIPMWAAGWMFDTNGIGEPVDVYA
jgi:PKD repeat protein